MPRTKATPATETTRAVKAPEPALDTSAAQPARRGARTARPLRNAAIEVHGSLWVAVGGQPLGGHGRIALLRAVAEHGSITHAAQAFGMSYKGAWDAIDTMNRRAGTPLVERVTGGRGGGSTRLTEHGRKLVERYEAVDAVHQRFVRLLADNAMDLNQDFSLLKVLNMKTSARNQWAGTVAAIRAGAVNDEVEVALPGGARIAATVTRESTDKLALRVQQPVIAMVKASAVTLAVGLGDARVSARNRLDGTVASVKPGAVNAEVTLQAAGGLGVTAIVTQVSLKALGLAAGQAATALVNAADVLLATVD